MFKTLFTLIVLGATFLLGYHLGRQPNSPDVVGWVQTVSQRVTQAGTQAIDAAAKKADSTDGRRVHEQASR